MNPTGGSSIVEQYEKIGDDWYYILLVQKGTEYKELTRAKLDSTPDFVLDYEAREDEIAKKEKEFKDSCTRNYNCPPPVEVIASRKQRKAKLRTSNKEKQVFLDAMDSAETEEEMFSVFREFGMEVEVEVER